MTDAGRLYLGVDGGGSKTRALVGDAEGRVLGTGESTSSNPKSIGFDGSKTVVLAAMQQALAHAGVAVPIAGAALGLAGFDRPEDRDEMLAWLVALGIARTNTIVQDTKIVLAAVSACLDKTGQLVTDPWGIALICGTGSVCHGIARNGAQVRAGGWGYLLGDEGSGYDLALRAMRLATQTADGRASARGVLDAALAHFDCAVPDDLAVRVYTVPRGVIAAFAARILSIAERGDTDARELVTAVAADAAALLVNVAERLGEPSAPIAFAGGLLSNNASYRDAVAAVATRRGVTNADLAVVVRDPAEGALALARRLEHRTLLA